jgi:hypothetical protein
LKLLVVTYSINSEKKAKEFRSFLLELDEINDTTTPLSYSWSFQASEGVEELATLEGWIGT